MFKIFVNSWKTKEIRNKILYTLMIFAIVRLGTQIALPGIDTAGVIAARENASMAGTLYSVIAGGANSSWSIFCNGIISHQRIHHYAAVDDCDSQVRTAFKEGPDGRKKLQSYSRYLTVILALIQGIGLTYTYHNMYLVHSPLVFMLHLYFVWYAAPHLLCGWRSRLLQAESATVPL